MNHRGRHTLPHLWQPYDGVIMIALEQTRDQQNIGRTLFNHSLSYRLHQARTSRVIWDAPCNAIEGRKNHNVALGKPRPVSSYQGISRVGQPTVEQHNDLVI